MVAGKHRVMVTARLPLLRNHHALSVLLPGEATPHVLCSGIVLSGHLRDIIARVKAQDVINMDVVSE